MRASEIRALLKWVTQPGMISFGGGMPDPRTFPKEEIAEIAREVILEKGEKALQYCSTEGVDEFREEVTKFVAKKGIKAEMENVMVTTGSQQTIFLTSRILIDEGDTVIVELPTYLAAIQAFLPERPEFVGIPMDDDGMIMEKLEETLKKLKQEGKKPKFLYTIPTCQNPAGITMSMDRRKRLLELASEYDFLIFEDDPYSYFLFEEKEVKPVKALDQEGRVIYTSTLSKILSPGMRLGWIIAEEEIIQRYMLAKQAVDLCSSTLTQYIAAEALRRGLVEKRIPFIRDYYKEKRDRMIARLEEHMPEGSRWTHPIGGLFLFLYLPEKINTRKLLEKCLKQYKVAFVPGQAFFVENNLLHTVNLAAKICFTAFFLSLCMVKKNEEKEA